MSLTLADLALSLGSGLVGAIVGGVISAFGSVKAVKASQSDIEFDELRRLRLVCFSNIMGLRHVLSNGLQSSDADRSTLSYEFNRAPVLWANDRNVVNLLQDVMSSTGPQKDAKLVELFRAMGRSTMIEVTNLADGDLSRMFHIRS